MYRLHSRSRRICNLVSGNVRTCQCLTRWWAAFDPSAMSGRLLITKSEAAEQLGVSVRTIERLISAGRLPLVHVEGAARVRVTDLGAFVQGLDANSRTTPSCADDQ
jgi:excisionase family DNA binding protein